MTSSPRPTDTVTTHQVALALRVSEGTVRRWLGQARIRGELVDGRWRIPASELESMRTLERQARAWRAVGGSHTKAAVRRTPVDVATCNRSYQVAREPRVNGPAAVKDLQNAVDDRVRLSVKTSPGPQVR